MRLISDVITWMIHSSNFGCTLGLSRMANAHAKRKLGWDAQTPPPPLAFSSVLSPRLPSCEHTWPPPNLLGWAETKSFFLDINGCFPVEMLLGTSLMPSSVVDTNGSVCSCVRCIWHFGMKFATGRKEEMGMRQCTRPSSMLLPPPPYMPNFPLLIMSTRSQN